MGSIVNWKLTPVLPGIEQCHTIRFTDPSASVSGLATNPYKTPKKTSKTKYKIKKTELISSKEEKKSNMGVIFAPSFAFLSKTATSYTSRHCLSWSLSLISKSNKSSRNFVGCGAILKETNFLGVRKEKIMVKRIYDP